MRILAILFILLIPLSSFSIRGEKFDSIIFSNIQEFKVYHVIVGSFKSYYYAYDYKKSIQNNGYNDVVILPINDRNLYRVSIKSFSTNIAAQEYIKKIKGFEKIIIEEVFTSQSKIEIPTEINNSNLKINDFETDLSSNDLEEIIIPDDIDENINDTIVYESEDIENPKEIGVVDNISILDTIKIKTFHVISSSTKSYYYAYDNVKELKNRGYDNAVVLPLNKNNLYPISIDNFNSINDANNSISLNNDFPNLRIDSIIRFVSAAEINKNRKQEIINEEKSIALENPNGTSILEDDIDKKQDFSEDVSLDENSLPDDSQLEDENTLAEEVDEYAGIEDPQLEDEYALTEEVDEYAGIEDPQSEDEYTLTEEVDEYAGIEDPQSEDEYALLGEVDNYAPPDDINSFAQESLTPDQVIPVSNNSENSINEYENDSKIDVVPEPILSEKNEKSNKLRVNIFDAKKRYERTSYMDAQNKYLKLLRTGKETQESLEYLANTYFNNSQYDKAVTWYNKLLVKYPEEVSEENLFRASLSFKSVGAYDVSDDLMRKYLKKSNNLIIKNEFENNPNYLDTIYSNSRRHRLIKTNINTENSEFGPNFYGNEKVVFSSTTSSTGDDEYEWSGEKFLDLFEAEIDSLGEISNPKILNGQVNTMYHESSAAFSNDLKTMYFTRNNYTDGRLASDRNRKVRLKLYSATSDDGESWSNIKELPFNSDQYSVAHPTLSKDGKRLYFASDMTGSYGYSDIWYVDIFEQDDEILYGNPINLGPKVNTEFRESFPFIDDNDLLYFSSDGRIGLGGFDVFKTELNRRGFPSQAENLAEPINSPFDDFGFVYNNSKKFGYISSNRSGFLGSKSDEVYKVKLNKCDYVIQGIVRDSNTREIIPGALVKLLSKDGRLLSQVRADDKARYSFDDNFDCDKSYILEVSNGIGYGVVRNEITTSNISNKLVEDFDLDWAQDCIPSDLECILKLNPIYFDLDESYITSDARVELNKVYVAMIKNPEMRIQIESHTDSRASEKYNLSLSIRRAKSTKAWLVKKGIDTDRINERGFGEGQLENYCEDNVDCDEKEHQLNRRSVFTIIN